MLWNSELVALLILCFGIVSWLLYLNCDVEERVGCFTLIVLWNSELVALLIL